MQKHPDIAKKYLLHTTTPTLIQIPKDLLTRIDSGNSSDDDIYGNNTQDMNEETQQHAVHGSDDDIYGDLSMDHYSNDGQDLDDEDLYNSDKDAKNINQDSPKIQEILKPMDSGNSSDEDLYSPTL